MNIPLEHAYICLNCDAITTLSDHCEVCSSISLWPLHKWMGKVAVAEEWIKKDAPRAGQTASPGSPKKVLKHEPQALPHLRKEPHDLQLPKMRRLLQGLRLSLFLF